MENFDRLVKQYEIIEEELRQQHKEIRGGLMKIEQRGWTDLGLSKSIAQKIVHFRWAGRDLITKLRRSFRYFKTLFL